MNLYKVKVEINLQFKAVFMIGIWYLIWLKASIDKV